MSAVPDPSSPTTTSRPPFTTVLVANRGEIACRIIATLHRLGVRAVAVHSDADRDAKHVRMADVAVRIGPPAPEASYLDIGAVVAAAQATGAQAIHPGYGFLAENADLARACAAAGLVFVGPGARALDVMGDKIRAKAHVGRAGVPVIPGTAEPGLDDAGLVAAAADVGYPLLIKPSAGGGGKGMEVVDRPADLPAALAAARRVARAAFGDDTLLLERYLPAPRHVEVQVLADAHGGVVHLGERECSLQRRHQKVIEEAPSPLVDPVRRDRIGALACEVARSVGYVGVGTVELLVSAQAPDDFYFMEMNTRLQVEHPVTELVTGIDLVEWQLRVAAGEPLAFGQEEVRLTGHAIEARVYAENPERGFLPTTGRVLVLEEPTGDGVRVDSALLPGLTVSSSYDPLLAKVVAWGRDRDEALTRLDQALARTLVLGVRTNVEYLRQVLDDPEVRAGRLDTGLLARRWSEVRFRAPDTPVLVAAALSALAHGAEGDHPWQRDGWRVGAPAPTRVHLSTGPQEEVEVAVRGTPEAATVTVDDGEPMPASLVRLGPDTVSLQLGGLTRTLRVAHDGDVTWVGAAGVVHELRRRTHAARLADRLARATRAERAVSPEIRSPMPGTVVAVAVASGDVVVPGQTLLVVEAMKMEHKLTATSDGVVTLTVRPHDLVTLDQVVATIAPHPQGHEGSTP